MTVSELFGRAQSFCLLCKLQIKSNTNWNYGFWGKCKREYTIKSLLEQSNWVENKETQSTYGVVSGFRTRGKLLKGECFNAAPILRLCIHPWWFVCLRSSLDHILAERQKCYGQFSAKKKNRSRTGILKMFRLIRTWKGISVVWAFRVEMPAKTKNARTLKQNCVSAWNLRSDLSKLFNLARLIFRGCNSVRQI